MKNHQSLMAGRRCRRRYCRVIAAIFAVVVAMTILPSTTPTIHTTIGVVVTAMSSPSSSSRNKVAVLGATGRLGQQTVKQLVKQNIPVRCLVRPTSVKNLPHEFLSNPAIEIIPGEFLLAPSSPSTSTSSSSSSSSNNRAVLFSDETAEPSAELISCLEGCSQCVACFGATRRTKISDFFSSKDGVMIEDTDPIHAKQINYRSMIALLKACKAKSSTNSKSSNSNVNDVKHIVRITGKGEDPNGIFSILLNGLGSYCKAWNYQGEVVLRSQSDIGYTIIRPGIMKDEVLPPAAAAPAVENKDGRTNTNTNTKNPERRLLYLELADNGGSDLKVSPVEYNQIAELLSEIVVAVEDGKLAENNNNNRVTLAAMNVEGDVDVEGDDDSASASLMAALTLKERILALRNDRREFPKSLVAEHKAAVNGFFTKVAAVVSIGGIGFVALIISMLI